MPNVLPPHRMRGFVVAAVVALAAVALPGCEPDATPTLHVVRDRLYDQDWQPIQLRGVNRPGLEYRCTAWAENPGWAGFLTDDDQTPGGRSPDYIPTVVAAFDTWPGINTVRVPLNEGCWLGTMPGPYSGAPYRAFVAELVAAITKSGRYTILDLHWSAPGTHPADGQDVAPNREHSLPFWTSVADTFKGDRAVAFDLFNEPRVWCWTAGCQGNYAEAVAVGWGCYLRGCTYTYRYEDQPIAGDIGESFEVVGTQELTEAIRNTGARNVVIVEGLGWGNALDNWETYKPIDLTNQLVASIHMYPSSGANVNNVGYLDAGLERVTKPLLVGEFGEQVCPAGTGFATRTIAWADLHGYSWTAWGWDRGEGCWGPSLVTSNDTGAPTVYGAEVKAGLAP